MFLCLLLVISALSNISLTNQINSIFTTELKLLVMPQKSLNSFNSFTFEKTPKLGLRIIPIRIPRDNFR